MRVVFRADSSREIGSGHIVRDMTLAEVLRGGGAQVIFVCRAHDGALLELLAQRQFTVLALPLRLREARYDGPYGHWLGAPQQQDARDTIDALVASSLPHCDWMVVDHYGIDRTWETILEPVAERIMVIDDLADRKHHCNLLLDQNLVAGFRDRYRGLVARDTVQLLGPQYAVLHPQYAALRLAKMQHTRLKNVLAYFGASDPYNLTGMTIRSFAALPDRELTLSVVVGNINPYEAEILELAGNDSRIRVYPPLPSLAELLAQADICVGAGGATTWERLCLQVPSLVYALADNQVAVSEHLDQLGAIRFMGHARNASVTDLSDALLQALSRDWTPQWEGVEVDGLGAPRVATRMLQNHP
ncbi:UDP-2,4-diacetamido-2,4,6-trideoxy-beta-L-altropyranose hydrolase [Devosia alba]|uniref:UDP-2,4-diacetamido-2,4, 6-trideoxy-beta-L-altropyranose hydrolase n=1 Tax=Devosia alba TaxID=3152360 RepID=UPI0032664273